MPINFLKNFRNFRNPDSGYDGSDPTFDSDFSCDAKPYQKNIIWHIQNRENVFYKYNVLR